MNDIVRVADDITAAYVETKNLHLDIICRHEPGQAVPASACEQFQCGLKQRLITKEKIASYAKRTKLPWMCCQLHQTEAQEDFSVPE